MGDILFKHFKCWYRAFPTCNTCLFDNEEFRKMCAFYTGNMIPGSDRSQITIFTVQKNPKHQWKLERRVAAYMAFLSSFIFQYSGKSTDLDLNLWSSFHLSVWIFFSISFHFVLFLFVVVVGFDFGNAWIWFQILFDKQQSMINYDYYYWIISYCRLCAD